MYKGYNPSICYIDVSNSDTSCWIADANASCWYTCQPNNTCGTSNTSFQPLSTHPKHICYSSNSCGTLNSGISCEKDTPVSCSNIGINGCISMEIGTNLLNYGCYKLCGKDTQNEQSSTCQMYPWLSSKVQQDSFLKRQAYCVALNVNESCPVYCDGFYASNGNVPNIVSANDITLSDCDTKRCLLEYDTEKCYTNTSFNNNTCTYTYTK